MRYCVISDIHSNYEALTAVLDYLKTNPVDKIISCGDIIGYGPDPRLCIDAVKSLTNFRSVAGNHDAAASGRISDFDFNEPAKASLAANLKMMTEEDKNYLLMLDEFISENDVRFVHGSPRDCLNEYLFLVEKFRENMSYFPEKVCFVGHTHHPLIYIYDMSKAHGLCMNLDEDLEIINLAQDKKYIINVGSVGQPRDYKPSACVVFYDTKSCTLTFKRISYNYKATQEKMIKLGMPRELIERLATGT